MFAGLGRIIIYTKRVEAMVDFYCTHFGFEVLRLEGDRIVELISGGLGANILLHPMSEGRKEGQTLIKLVFDVEDVETFCRKAKARGLHFGSIHQAGGYSICQCKRSGKELRVCIEPRLCQKVVAGTYRQKKSAALGALSLFIVLPISRSSTCQTQQGVACARSCKPLPTSAPCSLRSGLW